MKVVFLSFYCSIGRRSEELWVRLSLLASSPLLGRKLIKLLCDRFHLCFGKQTSFSVCSVIWKLFPLPMIVERLSSRWKNSLGEICCANKCALWHTRRYKPSSHQNLWWFLHEKPLDARDLLVCRLPTGKFWREMSAGKWTFFSVGFEKWGNQLTQKYSGLKPGIRVCVAPTSCKYWKKTSSSSRLRMPSSRVSMTLLACSASSSDVACCSFVFSSLNLSNKPISSACSSNSLREKEKKTSVNQSRFAGKSRQDKLGSTRQCEKWFEMATFDLEPFRLEKLQRSSTWKGAGRSNGNGCWVCRGFW